MNTNDYLDLTEIKSKYDAGDYRTKLHFPAGCRLSEDYIFDVDKTVRENRDMVKRHNDMLDQQRKEYNDDNNRLNKQLRDDVVNYLIKAYGFSKARAEYVESYIYTEKHSSMYDYFTYVDEFADFIENLP